MVETTDTEMKRSVTVQALTAALEGFVIGTVLARAPEDISPTWAAAGAIGVALLFGVERVWRAAPELRAGQTGGPAGATPPGGGVDALYRFGVSSLACIGLVGAIALALAYAPLGPHQWFHAHQYMVAYALVAAGSAGLATLLARARHGDREDGSALGAQLQRAMPLLNAGFIVAAAVGLAFLLSSGKLWLGRSDWPANVVFVTTGLWAIAVAVGVAIVARARGQRTG